MNAADGHIEVVKDLVRGSKALQFRTMLINPAAKQVCSLGACFEDASDCQCEGLALPFVLRSREWSWGHCHQRLLFDLTGVPRPAQAE